MCLPKDDIIHEACVFTFPNIPYAPYSKDFNVFLLDGIFSQPLSAFVCSAKTISKVVPLQKTQQIQRHTHTAHHRIFINGSYLIKYAAV